MTDPNDNEQLYRAYVAELISRSKSKGNTRYFNQFVNKCRDDAALLYPKGAAEVNKKQAQLSGWAAVIAFVFSFFA
jgi:hypothetical protein